MTKNYKWIFILVMGVAFIVTAATQGKCAGSLSQEVRIDKIVNAYEVENTAATLMFFNYMHYYLDEMIDFHIDEPDIKVELAPTGAQIGLQSMSRLFKAGDRSKVPSSVAQSGGGEMEVHGFGSPSEAMPMMMGGNHGEMHIHEMDGMVVEVADDCQTAQIMFNSTGREGSDWAWIKYGVDCKKDEDGNWKIWHTHVYGTTGNSYFEDWADTKGYMNDPGMGMPGMGEGGMPGGGMPGMEEGGMPGGGMDMQSDRPSEGKWVYTGGTSETYSSIPPLLPIPPEPCATWNPEKAY